MAVQFFKPAHSQQNVPTYAPLPLDTIKYGAQQAGIARERANKAMDAYSATHEDILGQLTPANQRQAQSIIAESDEFLDSIIDPEAGVRYQDMPILVRRQARKTQERIKPYLEDSARVKQFQTRVQEMYDKGNLDEDLRSYYQRQLEDYQGLQINEDGTRQGFRAPNVVRSQDIDGQIDAFMNQFIQGNEQVLIDEFGEDPRFIKEIRQTGRSPEELQYIRQVVASKIMNRPENQQYLSAKAEAESDLRRRVPEEELNRLYESHVEQRQKSGERALGREEFIDQYRNVTASDMAERYINPYIAAEALGRTQQSLRSNPGFNTEGSGGMDLTTPVKVGTFPSSFTSVSDMNQKISEMEEGLKDQAQQLRMALPRELQEQVTVGEDGMLQGSDHPEVLMLNSRLEQGKKQLDNYRKFDQDLRKEAGLKEISSDDRQALDNQFENYLNSLGYRKEGPNAATEREWEQLKDTHWELFQQSDAFDEALEEVSAPYQRYLELFNARTTQGTIDVQVPASLSAKQSEDYKRNLFRLAPSRPVYNAMTRREYGREEGMELLHQADRIEPVGPFTDVSGDGRTYTIYNVWESEDTKEPTPVMIDLGVSSLAAFEASGYGRSVESVLQNEFLNMGNDPGADKSFSIPLGESEDLNIQVELLPVERQNAIGKKYRVLLPNSEGGYLKPVYYNSEPEARSALKNYLEEFSKLNTNE